MQLSDPVQLSHCASPFGTLNVALDGTLAGHLIHTSDGNEADLGPFIAGVQSLMGSATEEYAYYVEVTKYTHRD